jgi:glycosyltransferase involved in cell wall biosynthesis
VISYSVVIPTIGRDCLRDCLAALGTASGPAPEQVVVVDDRPARSRPLEVDPGPLVLPLRIVTSGGAGPAAARNAGWQVTDTPWVASLDDDVQVSGDWRSRLAEAGGFDEGCGCRKPAPGMVLAGVRVAGDLAEAVRMITGEIPLASIWPNEMGD